MPHTPQNTTTEQGPAKRPKKRPFQPTSPSPTPKHTATELLQQALRLAEQAYQKQQNEATESAIRALKSAIGGGNGGLSLEQKVDLLLRQANLATQPNQQGQQTLQQQQPQKAPQAPQAPSYAAIAAKKPTEQHGKPAVSKPQPTQKPNQLPKSIGPGKVTVRVTRGPTDYSPMAIRNAINQKLGSIMVAKVATSQRNNFVITLLPNYYAAEFIGKKPLWQSAFEAYGIQGVEEPSTWLKLIAHGVPTRDFNLGLFKAEVETFNPNVRVKGSPRWLNQPSQEKRAGSVVFTVATEAEKQTCI